MNVEISSDKNVSGIFKDINQKISPHGYEVSYVKKEKKEGKNTLTALLLGLCILALFFYLQKSGILNIGIG
jgi:hypothetical protein